MLNAICFLEMLICSDNGSSLSAKHMNTTRLCPMQHIGCQAMESRKMDDFGGGWGTGVGVVIGDRDGVGDGHGLGDVEEHSNGDGYADAG